MGFMKIKIVPNEKLEAFTLIDVNSDQDHDGDGAKEVIAEVYDEGVAHEIKTLLETWVRI